MWALFISQLYKINGTHPPFEGKLNSHINHKKEKIDAEYSQRTVDSSSFLNLRTKEKIQKQNYMQAERTSSAFYWFPLEFETTQKVKERTKKANENINKYLKIGNFVRRSTSRRGEIHLRQKQIIRKQKLTKPIYAEKFSFTLIPSLIGILTFFSEIFDWSNTQIIIIKTNKKITKRTVSQEQKEKKSKKKNG